jgi:hypothetical protein
MKQWLDKYFVNGFFGWENLKWIIRELLKVGSNQPSFFSKKRIESGIAFFVLQFGLLQSLGYLLTRPSTPMSEFAIWAGIECLICGYTLNKIEEAKKHLPKDNTSGIK